MRFSSQNVKDNAARVGPSAYQWQLWHLRPWLRSPHRAHAPIVIAPTPVPNPPTLIHHPSHDTSPEPCHNHLQSQSHNLPDSLPGFPNQRDNDLLGLHQRARNAIPRLRHRHWRATGCDYGFEILSTYTGCAAFVGVWAVLEVWGLDGMFYFVCGGMGRKRGEDRWIG